MNNSKLLPVFIGITIVQTAIIGFLFFEIEFLNRNLKASYQSQENFHRELQYKPNEIIKSNIDSQITPNTEFKKKTHGSDSNNENHTMRKIIRQELKHYFENYSANELDVAETNGLPKNSKPID